MKHNFPDESVKVSLDLLDLIYDIRVIVFLIIGFIAGSFFAGFSVLEAFHEMDKAGIDICVRSGELGPSSSYRSPSVVGEGDTQ